MAAGPGSTNAATGADASASAPTGS
jgi:hypothetical protein